MSKILIVDDDRVLRNLSAYSLGEMAGGFEFETCRTGAEAVRRVLRGDDDIDLIIMDVRMPEMNGIDAIREIRQVSIVPVIVLSAYGDEATRNAAMAAGASLFFTKPVSYLHLAGQIQRLARGRRRRRYIPEQLRRLRENLAYLQTQAAGYGPLATPLELHNQIEETQRQIEAIENGDTPQ